MKNLIALLLLTSVACAAKPYKINDVSLAKRSWRFCSAAKDGESLHRKGFCYVSQECRERWLRKDECRPLPLFCKWGDVSCYDKYELWTKKVR